VENTLFILIGLFLLFVGGEAMVRGASSIALDLSIPPIIVGLTIVSFSTSAPELVVSLDAALNDHSDLAVGNVVGSNLSNIGLTLGLTALFFRIKVNRKHFNRDISALLLITLVYYLLLQDGRTSLMDGIILVSLLFSYLGLLYYFTLRERQGQEKANRTGKHSMVYWVMQILVGMVGLKYGAEFLVNGSVELATKWGVSERIISLTVVSIGTSLPELFASLIAALRGQRDMALGNVLGSNIFNIGSVIGLSSIITPIEPSSGQLLAFDFPFMIMMTLSILALMTLRPVFSLNSWKGGLLFAGYIAYMFLILQ
jgi:cation:H+ antiporter